MFGISHMGTIYRTWVFRSHSLSWINLLTSLRVYTVGRRFLANIKVIYKIWCDCRPWPFKILEIRFFRHNHAICIAYSNICTTLCCIPTLSATPIHFDAKIHLNTVPLTQRYSLLWISVKIRKGLFFDIFEEWKRKRGNKRALHWI